MAQHAPTTCWHCGGPAVLELAEAWSDHAFQLETCCLASYEEVCSGMADDPGWACHLLRHLGAEVLVGHHLRRVADTGCGQLLLDWSPEILPVTFAQAAGFVRRHHVHNAAPTAWRYSARIRNGTTLLAVVMVGNPVARALMGRGTVEVNRLCIRRDVPRALAWNACSQLYGWVAREAEARGFRRIITYTRANEDGGSLRAAGWIREAHVRGRSWNSPTRARTDRAPLIDKHRWSRALKPHRVAARPPVPPAIMPLFSDAAV